MAPNKLAKQMKKEKDRVKASEDADRMTVPETGRRTVPDCWDDEPTELFCSVPQEGSLSVVCPCPTILDACTAVRVPCSSSICLKSGLMHTRCFQKYEDLVLRGLAMKLRSQPEKQLRMSMWQTRYKMCYEMCACDCGQGFLQKDLEGSSEERPEISKSKAKNAKPINNKPKLMMTGPPQKKNKQKMERDKRVHVANLSSHPDISMVKGAASTIPGLYLTKSKRKDALVNISEDLEQKEPKEEEIGWNQVGKLGAVKKHTKLEVGKLNDSQSKDIVKLSNSWDTSKNITDIHPPGKMVTPESLTPTDNPGNQYNRESPPVRQDRHRYNSTDSQDSGTASVTLAWGTGERREDIFHSDDSDASTDVGFWEGSLNKATKEQEVDTQHRSLVYRKLGPVSGCVSLTACSIQRQLVVQLKEQNAELKEEIKDFKEKLNNNVQMKNVPNVKVKSLEEEKSGFQHIVCNIQNEVVQALNKFGDTLDHLRLEQQLRSEALSSHSLSFQTGPQGFEEMNRNIRELKEIIKGIAKTQQEERMKNLEDKINIMKQLEDMQELARRHSDPRND